VPTSTSRQSFQHNVHDPWTLSLGRNADVGISCFSRSRQPGEDGGPWLHKVAAGGGLALAAPQPRRRSPELQARLNKLQRALDEKQYAAMVADVTEAVRPACLHPVGPSVRACSIRF
jgi:hypothetical protein